MRNKSHFSILVLITLTGFLACALAFSVSAKVGSPHVIQISPNGQGQAYSVAYSPNGQILAVGSSLGIHFYNSSDLKSIRFTPTDSWVRVVAFSPDGKTLASGSYDPVVRLWRVSDGTLLTELKGHTAWVRALVFSPNGEILATGSDDNTVRLWGIPKGDLKYSISQGTEGVRAVAFSPDGTILATGGYDDIIRLWQVSDGTLLRELTGSTGWIRALAFSPNGEWLASGGFDHLVHLWRVADGELLVTRHEHSSSITGLAFSPDGEILASADVDTTVRLWKMPTLEPYDMLTGHTDFVFSVAFSPDGKSLASGGADNSIRVWDVPVEAGPAAQEQVSSLSDCRKCHHPGNDGTPPRVIEVNCAACHPEGALNLNWCPVVTRAVGGTTVEVTTNAILGREGGVPRAARDFGVEIASPGNGAHIYAPETIRSMLPINGTVYSKTIALTDIEIQLQIWTSTEQVTSISTRPAADGTFSFSANIRPGGNEPYPGFLGRNYCAACHLKLKAVLPAGEVHLVVVATAPDGTKAMDERWVSVDDSQNVLIPVIVIKEDGQPVPNIPIISETRLYEWRGRTFMASSDANGQASLQVETLAQNPTTYQISIPPTVIDGVMYESIDRVQVTLPPGATSAAAVTLHVQAASGEINGHVVTGLDAPLQVWAISLPDGGARTTTTSPQGIFTFSELSVGQVLLTADPQALAEQGMALSAESIDLSQSLSVHVDLIPQPLEGASLNGKITDETGASLPFAWVSEELHTGQTDPASGGYQLFGIPAGKATAIINAPGYYSQAASINGQQAADSTTNFSLIRRPETRIIPWGTGAIVIPLETVASMEGQIITFEQGWLWGKGKSEQPLVIQWGDMQISISGGRFALERLPARSGWLYVMEGQAFIQRAGTAVSVMIQAGEMVFLNQEQQPHPVTYDPVVIAALHLNDEAPIAPAWQPSLEAQVRDRLARIGIGTAQIVTYITYFMEVLALLVMFLLAVNWVIKKNKKEIKRDKTRSN